MYGCRSPSTGVPPFVVASLCSAVAAVAVAWVYRPPPTAGASAGPQINRLPKYELLLTLVAAAAWGLFNAGYVVYLSFAPKVLESQGYGTTQAAAVVSIASWVMILSVTFIGRIADRTGRHAVVLCLCMAVAVASLLLLRHAEWSVALSLAFGLLGMAPAGIIMALTAQSMAPQRRAFGMGVFLSFYFVIQTVAPPLAGWLFDRSGEPFVAIKFASALFAATAVCHIGFGLLKRRLARA